VQKKLLNKIDENEKAIIERDERIAEMQNDLDT